MKSLLTACLLAILSIAAQAQTSSQSLSNLSPSPENQSGTLTETLKTSISPEKSKFGANVLLQGWVGVGDLKDHGQAALVDSENGVGLTYKLSDKWDFELRHGFELRRATDRSRIKGLRDQQETEYKTLDPQVHANYNSSWTLFGSKPISFLNRYYIPVSDDARDLQSSGTFRSQTSINWELNPHITLSAVGQARLYMFRDNVLKDISGLTGSHGDSVLWLQTGVSPTYNFSDSFNAYYFPYLMTVGTGFQRGDMRANKMNSFWQEIGINYVVGSVTINPAYATYASALNQAGYSGMGTDGNSEYDLNILASF